MIDYDKLKEAHKYLHHTNLWLEHEVGSKNSPDGEYWSTIRILQDGGDVLYEDSNVDFIIEKLKELTKPKYKLRQKWWAIGNLGGAFEVEIVGIMGADVDLEYPDGSRRYGGIKELYPSREALIKSQLDYWRNQLLAAIDEQPTASCCSLHAGTDDECGEFYR